MNATTDTIQRFAWDGPIGLEWIVPIALILVALLTWALMRERGVLGDRYFRLFWLLRTAALFAALWMLLAPSRVVTERTTVKQTLVIATDVSPSMGVVDKPDTADEVRWTIAGSDAVEAGAIESADRAVVSARMATASLQSAERLADQQASTDVVLKEVASAIKALERVKEHLQVVAQESEQPEKTRAVLRLLDDEAFYQLRIQSESDRKTSLFGWQDQLGDAVYNALAIQRRTTYLADHVRDEQGSRIQSLNAKELNQVRGQSRLKRVVGALEQLDFKRASSDEKTAVIQHCSFDSTASSLVDQTPSKQLVRYLGRENVDNQVTDLNESLAGIKGQHSDGRLAAVILYSDALHTADTPQLPQLKFEDTPIYVVPIGNPKHVRDVAIQAVLAPSVVMQNDTVVIEVDLQTYDCNGEACTVELRSDEKTLSHQSLKITNDASIRRVRFDTKIGELGRHEFMVRVVPVENEVTEENNSESFEVNVTRAKIGVLLADEVPRWEFRYLAQLFRRDPKIEADELLFEPRIVATGAREDDKAFPTTVDAWAQYDVVILGDVETKHLSPQSQQSLATYLRERGGSLVLIAGSEAMPSAYANQPLQAILPVKKMSGRSTSRDGYSLRITEGGNRHHALMIAEDSVTTQMAWEFVNRNAPVGWLSSFRQPRATARTLIEAIPRGATSDNQQAFLCWQPVGRGRVIYFSGPETYRLRYLRGDKYHFRLWGQLLRWAIASDLSESNRLVKLRSDKNRYDENENVMLSVQLVDQDNHPIRDAEISAVANTEEGAAVNVQLKADENIPGRYNGQMKSLAPGRYDWHIDGIEELLGDDLNQPVGRFLVRPFVSKELMDTRCDLVLAQKIAEATGGQVLPPTAVEEVIELTDLDPIVTETTKSNPLWSRWELMFLVIGCLSTEWVIRKWKGYS